MTPRRGEVYRIRPPRGGGGHEQHGARYGVVVQTDDLAGLSTVLIAPTSRSAAEADFRPRIDVGGQSTRVLVEQLAARDVRRLGGRAGRISAAERDDLDGALRLVLGLDLA